MLVYVAWIKDGWHDEEFYYIFNTDKTWWLQGQDYELKMTVDYVLSHNLEEV